MGCSLVDTRDKESGGTIGAPEAVSFNAIRRDVSDVVDSTGGTVQFSCDVMGHDVMRAMQGVIVAIEGAVREGVVLAEMM